MTYDFETTLVGVPGRGGSKKILNKNAKSMLMQLTKCYNFINVDNYYCYFNLERIDSANT